MPSFIDLTGQNFGKLTVIKKAEGNYSRIHWECKCNCGNPETIIVSGQHLRSGHTKSCGCLQRAAARNTNFIDITNQRFGKLIALENIGSNKQGQALWKCKCDCGNIITVKGIDLRFGHTTSCGCRISFGEEKINKILLANNINFITQKTFEDCRFPDSFALARFDFFINNSFLIEYDGIQHFQKFNTSWDKQERFEKRLEHDQYKTKWCEENNIPLIRIPYTHLQDLCIDDLLLETTKYRVV